MKKFFMISVLMGALPLSMVAQDDLYFVPKKKSAEVVEVTTPINNRVKSQYEVIPNDSVNDIIVFDGEKGIYPDSIITEDYELTKRMQRFEDYDLSDNAAFWAGYHLGRDTWDWGLSWHSPWYYTRYGWYGGWYDPWYYSYGFYDPWYYGGYYGGWYDPWRFGYYDPWYYTWYGGLYDPWYYGYYGWTYPRHYYYADVYYGGRPHYATNGTTGTQRHGRIDYSGPRGISNGRSTTHSSGTFGGSAIAGNRSNSNTRTTTAQGSTQRTTVRNASGNFGGNRSNSTTYSNSSSSNANRSGSFSGSSTRTSTVSSSSSSSMSSSSGGSFGGSRGGGGTIGGSRSGGGGGSGSFGGGRR